MKKFTLFLFTLVIGFITFCTLVVKADAITITLVDAAQVRTEGDYQGLRFEASVNTLEGTTEHGFFLALGTHSLSDMTTAISGGTATVGANKLLKKETTGEDLTFAVTIYDIPEAYYTTGITAVAYAYDGSSYTLSSIKVTRNIAEISLDAKNSVNDSTLINNVFNYVTTNYMFAGWKADGTYEITSSPYNHNYKFLAKDFLKDWNKFTGGSLVSLSGSSFFTSAKSSNATTGNSNNTVKDISDSNLYRFFNDSRYGTKWGWLLTFLNSKNDIHTTKQITAILGNGTNGDNALYGGEHLSNSIVGFFTKTKVSIYYNGINFASDSYYNGLLSTNTIYCNNNDFEYVRIGENTTLPGSIAKDGYTWVGYTDSESSVHDASSAYLVTDSDNIFTPTYNAITYNITYHLDGGNNSNLNPATYNIETATITLSEATKANHTFVGWFREGGFVNEVTEIARGSMGNIDLYAKFEEGVLPLITFDYKWNNEEIFLRFKADVIYYGSDSNEAEFLTHTTGHSYTYDYLPLKSAIDASSVFCNKWSWLFNAIADAHVYAKNEYIAGIRNLANGTVNTDSLYTFTQEMKGFYNGITAVCYYSDSHTQYNWEADSNNMYAHVYEACYNATKKQEYLQSGAAILEAPTSLRQNIIFEGWYLNSSYSGAKVTTVPNSETILYARWVSDSGNEINNTRASLDTYFASLGLVDSNLTLPLQNQTYGTTISWATSNKDAITAAGVYGTPRQNTSVTLTATITYNETSDSATYEVTAKRYYSDLTDGITAGYIYGNNIHSASDYTVENLDIAYVAFGYPNNAGAITMSSVSTYLNEFVTRCHSQGTFVVLSLQESSSVSSTAFSVIAADADLRETFANNLVTVINQYHLDGIDLDWETPDADEVDKYTPLVSKMYEKIKANNRYHLLTTAVYGSDRCGRYDLENSLQYFDYINLMTYDLHSSGASQFNSPLARASGKNYRAISDTYKSYVTDMHLPTNKMIIGLAFYGLKYTGTNGIYKSAASVSKPSYKTIYDDYISQLGTNPNLTRTWEDLAKCYYIYDSANNICVTYDEATSIGYKIAQAHEWGMAGAMYWQDGQDNGDELVTAVVNAVNQYYNS